MNKQKVKVKIDNFALIIGAMKCGTTSLFHYLAEHPEIAPCSKKEAFFFSASCWDKGFDWYQSLWQNWNPRQHKIALEASVDYTRIPTYANAAERIFSLQDRAKFKFIYIMRNPIERIESQYTHGQAAGWEGIEKTSSTTTIDRDLIVPSLYAMQIKEYYKRFPAENILLLNFDDLKTNPRDLLQQVCNFLEIDPNYEFQGLNTVHNAN
ncbi:MAG: sulfotransferase, partial [Prochloraceae cyanobacterium]|nr:sulfotransferase [Prochloraceae cyanobacterium]